MDNMIGPFNTERIPSILQSYKRTRICHLMFYQKERGSYLLLRTVSEAFWMFSIGVRVQDHFGETIYFWAYNYCSPFTSPKDVFPVGTIFALINPLKKLGSTDGIPMLRCDDPQEIMIIDRGGACTQLENKILELESEPTSGEEWKERGNDLYRRRNFDAAKDAYLTALKFKNNKSNTISLIQVNLAATYLALGYFESCLEFSLKVLKTMPGNIKAMYRAGRACYKLRRYEEAKDYFEKVLAKDKDNKESTAEIKKCLKRLDEKSGKVDIFELFKKSTASPQTKLGHADYVGPLKRIKDGVNRRGIVAQSDISPGTLLVVSKALEVDFSDEDNLVDLVAESAKKNPSFFENLINDMIPKDQDDKVKTPKGKTGDVELEKIRKVVTNNYLPLLTCDAESQYEIVKQGSGLFHYPSYFKHCCVPNAVWQTYNDILVIHAVQAIAKGEEVTISFEKCKTDYQFFECCFFDTKTVCECVLCKLNSQINQPEMKSLTSKYEELSTRNRLNLDTTQMSIEKLNRLIDEIETIYNAIDGNVLQVPLAYIYSRLATVLLEDYNVQETMENVEKAFNSLGMKSCDLFETVKKGETDVFPVGSCTSAFHLILELVVLLIRANEARGSLEEALAWVNVLATLERVCTGGTLDMVKVKYVEIPKDLL